MVNVQHMDRDISEISTQTRHASVREGEHQPPPPPPPSLSTVSDLHYVTPTSHMGSPKVEEDLRGQYILQKLPSRTIFYYWKLLKSRAMCVANYSQTNHKQPHKLNRPRLKGENIKWLEPNHIIVVVRINHVHVLTIYCCLLAFSGSTLWWGGWWWRRWGDRWRR